MSLSQGGKVRCLRCGTENSDTNRFCGMCGVPLTPKAAPTPPTGTPLAAPRKDAPTPEPRGASSHLGVASPPIPQAHGVVAPQRDFRPPRPAGDQAVMDDPIISGPSFLGLNQPARNSETDREFASADRGTSDGRERYSSNLNYLLEDDEEEEPRHGWGKAIAVVVALALLGGFGYLRWKQGGFDWLMKDNKPAQTAATTSDSIASGSGNNAAAAASQTSNPSSPSSAPAPSPADANSSSVNPTAANSPSTSDNSSAAAPGSTPPAPSDTGAAPPNSAAPSNSPAENALPNKTESPRPAPEAAAENEKAKESAADGGPPSDVKSPQIAPRKAQLPTPQKIREPKPTAATPADPTAQAESYVYGRGVPQDCDRGLQLLKPAAAHANVKAMIILGSLYSSGTCTPRDLPTSYRWFALALHQQPDSQTLQDDLQSVWAKMTQPERQLAIKLSQ